MHPLTLRTRLLRRTWLLPLLLLSTLPACTPQAPPPASTTAHKSVAGPSVARPIRVDGLVEPTEWAWADTTHVALPDGRTIEVLRQRGPQSLDFAFLGLGENAPRRIHPEILLDVSGRFPSQFSQDSWWFRIAPSRCVANGSTASLECDVQVNGLEASPPPVERQAGLEVSIGFSLLEYSPVQVPEIAYALRFAEVAEFAVATWPLGAELERPDTWSRLDLSQ